MLKRNITKKSETELDSRSEHSLNWLDLLNTILLTVIVGSAGFLWWSKGIENDRSREQVEFALILGLLVFAGLVAFVSAKGRRLWSMGPLWDSRIGRVVAVAASCVCIAGLGYRPSAQFPYLWHGYGFRPTLLALMGGVWMTFGPLHIGWLDGQVGSSFMRSKYVNRATRGVVLTLTLVVYGPVMIQTSSGIINGSDATHQVLEEISGPLVGNYPGVNFLGTYTSLLGIPLAPLRVFGLAGNVIMSIVLGWIGFLVVGTVVGVYSVARRSLPQLNRTALVVATCATVLAAGQWGSAASNVESMSMIPGRTFLPVLLCLSLAEALRDRSTRRLSVRFVAVGAIGICAGLNNVEFGVPALISATVVCLVAGIRARGTVRVFGAYVLGAIGALCAYAIFSFSVKGPYDFWYRIGVYAGERYSPGEVLPSWSLHNLLLAIFVGAVVLGLLGFIRSAPLGDDALLTTGSAVALYSGLWGLVAFPYCSYRCTSGMYMSTQVYLIPTFMCVVGCYGVLRDRYSSLESNRRLRGLKALPLSVLVLVGFVSVVQAPNPIDEWVRVTGNGLTAGWSTLGDRAPANEWNTNRIDWLDVRSVVQARQKIPSESVGYFGYMGNSFELATGIENFSGINSGEVLMIKGTATIRRLACVKLERELPTYLLVVGFDLPCPGYLKSPYDYSESDGVQVYERSQ